LLAIAIGEAIQAHWQIKQGTVAVEQSVVVAEERLTPTKGSELWEARDHDWDCLDHVQCLQLLPAVVRVDSFHYELVRE
jgi:hypothetical protein